MVKIKDRCKKSANREELNPHTLLTPSNCGLCRVQGV